MTGTEGETAVLALAVCAVTPWVLFLARIWKVSTASKPKQAGQAPDAAAVPAAEPVTEPTPLREAGAA